MHGNACCVRLTRIASKPLLSSEFKGAQASGLLEQDHLLMCRLSVQSQDAMCILMYSWTGQFDSTELNRY